MRKVKTKFYSQETKLSAMKDDGGHGALPYSAHCGHHVQTQVIHCAQPPLQNLLGSKFCAILSYFAR